MCFSCIFLFVLHVFNFVLFLVLLVSGSWLQFVIVALPGLSINLYEPPHEKTNKVDVRRTKTQISDLQTLRPHYHLVP